MKNEKKRTFWKGDERPERKRLRKEKRGRAPKKVYRGGNHHKKPLAAVPTNHNFQQGWDKPSIVKKSPNLRRRNILGKGGMHYGGHRKREKKIDWH